MATKAHPGKYDCYTKAEPNEPMFVLLARDRFAHGLVRLWASLRSHDYESAAIDFAHLCEFAKAGRRKDDKKTTEALACAGAMEAYYEGNPYCHVCLCVEWVPCPGGCSWANKEKTVCTNPACLAAAGLSAKKKGGKK